MRSTTPRILSAAKDARSEAGILVIVDTPGFGTAKSTPFDSIKRYIVRGTASTTASSSEGRGALLAARLSEETSCNGRTSLIDAERAPRAISKLIP